MFLTWAQIKHRLVNGWLESLELATSIIINGQTFTDTDIGGLSGPASSHDNAIARWDGTDGSTLQDSKYTGTTSHVAAVDDTCRIYTMQDSARGAMMTPEGGFAVLMINRTGTASQKGRVVMASTDNNNSVVYASAGSNMPVGVMYNSSVANGSVCWIVVGGLAEVLMEDNVSAVGGYWLGVSTSEAGYAETASAPPTALHWNEIGHCTQSKTATGAGTHVLSRAILHFN